MTPRFAHLGLAFLSLAVGSQSQAAQAPVPPPPSGLRPAAAGDDTMVTLKMPAVDLETVLSALEIYTGRSVLSPTTIAGPTTFNIRISEPVPKSQAILAIETVLALNGIGVVPQGDRFLIVTPLPQAARNAPEMITGSTLDLPPSGKLAAKVFQLEFLRVMEIQQMIGSMVNTTVQSPPLALQNANAIMVTDSVANLQRIETLLKQIDQPLVGGMKPKFYPLKEANATDVVQKLRTILGTLTNQLGMATTYSADDRTNQVVLVTDPRQYALFDELIGKLDVRADASVRNDVIYLKHANAEELAGVLNSVITGQTRVVQQRNQRAARGGQPIGQPQLPAQPPQVPGAPPASAPVQFNQAVNAAIESIGTNEFSALMTIQPDPRSNSIVVVGTADDLRLINGLIAKLDIVLAQVRIELVIAEVTLEDNHQSGISALGLQVDGDRLVGFNLLADGIGVGGSTALNEGDSSFASISRLGGPGSLGRSLDLTGVVSLGITPRKRNATILTVPAIVTSHGKEAIIRDGETRPVVTSSTTIPGAAAGATTSSQIVQLDIGTTITLTPYIGPDGWVQLALQQHLSDVTGTVTVDSNVQYIIGERETTSYITAKSGEIYVLGGFRKRVNLKETNRLGPLAFIGDLFGSRRKNYYHKELIFFLRPQVLENKSAIDNAETMKRVETLPTKDEIKRELDPNFVPEKPSAIDRALGK